MALGITSKGSVGLAAGANPVANFGFTMSPNRLYVVVINTVINGTPPSLAVPVGMTDGTWVQGQSYVYRTASFSRRIGIFYTVTGASPSGQALTASGQDASGTGGAMYMVEITGANLTTPVVTANTKVNPADTSGTSESITLTSALTKATNMLLACIANRGGGNMTAGGSGTEIVDDGASGAGMYYRIGGNSLSASWGVSDSKGSIGIEINALLTQAVAGTITPTGALATLHTYLTALAGSITPTGSLTTLYFKALSVAGSITPTGSLTTTRLRRLLRGLAEVVLNLQAKGTDTLHLDPRTDDTLHLTEQDEEQA
jgi:hypothetical protein